MAEETETQASASKAKGGRRGKMAQLQADNKAINKMEVKVLNNNTNKGTDSDSDSDLDSDSKQYNFHTLAKLLKPVPKLTSHNYYRHLECPHQNPSSDWYHMP
ncbi:hypothetical protein NDA14_003809 [Ustilago hordei]|uniref:Uncharacterized protein n=1 Tax=Ustilago hordei TaxID=120017 RepID=I2FRJ6_USTHO|nr:uncharacterized protein UHO2_07001 [Ustilago hordei]KAJ1044917.1 hypothetical protein NDA10_002659 [Ustilago hordei]KAJ1572028.1 hypothetical protein NDA15_002983 [Ustilago hordei]KAJ1594462.1 hypothetical protein NDA12_005098 [Ustilago hordei]KAJ1598287.1 hypothetical protein NDA14_003809 [Ustilago hordei]CCF49539.1 uncharacterized protein UHOR_03016 [Ustilago hordei]